MPQFFWDAAARRYLDASRNPVAAADIRKAVESVAAASRERLRAIGEQFAKDRDVATAFTSALDEVRAVNRAAAAVAHGGIRNMDARALGRYGQKSKTEINYLRDKFLLAEQSEEIGPRFIQELASYADSGVRVYENLRLAGAVDAGHTEALNQTGAEKSCSECSGLEAAGYIPIEDMPEVGSRICGPGCKCTVTTR